MQYILAPTSDTIKFARHTTRESLESYTDTEDGQQEENDLNSTTSVTSTQPRSSAQLWPTSPPLDTEMLPTEMLPTEMSLIDPAGAGTQEPRTVRDHILAAQLSRVREQKDVAYPSPTDSSIDSPSAHVSTRLSHSQNPLVGPAQMQPPFQSQPISHGNLTSKRLSPSESTLGTGDRSKRLRSSASSEARLDLLRNEYSGANNYPTTSTASSSLYPQNSPQRPQFILFSPTLRNPGGPLTPTTSIGTSDDSYVISSARPSPSIPHERSDPRRLSVDSLLSGPPAGGDEAQYKVADSRTTYENIRPGSGTGLPAEEYGFDRGYPDLDIPNNDDHNVLNGIISNEVFNNAVDVLTGHDTELPAEFGFGLYGTNTAHKSGGYYAHPVPVAIPVSLSPLPSTLLQNPMNLLYFHHFLNHTARILVPHDCSENPFKNILPQSMAYFNQSYGFKLTGTVAIRDVNLLHLLLAYSASHRARLLNHKEPAIRIAVWVRDVFPTLRHALNETTGQISNSNLATAIMLASLEIISPNTFEVPVPWQNHLNIARRMIVARGGAQSVHRKDKVSYFLSRWFAYLDVLGSLSGGKNDQPLFSGDYWSHDNDLDEENDFQIDCLLGFTSRCVSILAKIAELARQCDNERIDGAGNVRDSWCPSPETVAAAEKLKHSLQEARTHRYRGCPHRQADNEIEDGWDSLEMVATNEAFHWAGLVHLYRRALGRRSEDSEVQNAVREIVGALYKVRKGGTAEACLLFPMFTAGCEVKEEWQRERIMERLRCVEGLGMTQVSRCSRYHDGEWNSC